MKTEKRLIKFSLIAFCLLFTITGYSQEQLISKVKKIEKVYDEQNIKIVNIINAFGNINISHWNKNKLKVSVTIKVIAWENDDAERFIEKINPEMKVEKSKLGEYYFHSQTSFSNIKNQCNCKDDKKVYAPWFKKNAEVKQYSISYEIKLPATINNLTIINSYGDVSISDFSGKMQLNLRNGNFRAGRLKLDKSTDLFHIRYGKANIEALENSKLFLYSCKDAKIGSIKNVYLSSQFSEIQINNCSALYIKSRSDNITIDNLESLEGTGNFTDISINNLDKSVKFNNKSGTIKIDNIDPGFESISLDGQFNDYILNLNELDYILNADLEFTDLESPDDIYPGQKREALINGQATFEKKIGSKTTNSKITLKCSNCNVELK